MSTQMPIMIIFAQLAAATTKNLCIILTHNWEQFKDVESLIDQPRDATSRL